MLGTTGARFQGPSGSQVHHRNLWPPPLHPTRSLDFQQNGEGNYLYLTKKNSFAQFSSVYDITFKKNIFIRIHHRH